jgi:hypothetical protein
MMVGEYRYENGLTLRLMMCGEGYIVARHHPVSMITPREPFLMLETRWDSLDRTPSADSRHSIHRQEDD